MPRDVRPRAGCEGDVLPVFHKSSVTVKIASVVGTSLISTLHREVAQLV
jgi:hypothetical protein